MTGVSPDPRPGQAGARTEIRHHQKNEEPTGPTSMTTGNGKSECFADCGRTFFVSLPSMDGDFVSTPGFFGEGFLVGVGFVFFFAKKAQKKLLVR